MAAYELTRQALFAYLSGNGDLHAKNLSIYKPGTEWRASPAYDLPSTYFFGDHTLALPIDSGGRNKDISLKAFLALAESVGVSERAAIRVLEEQLEASEIWLERVDELPYGQALIADYRRFVANRIRLLSV